MPRRMVMRTLQTSLIVEAQLFPEFYKGALGVSRKIIYVSM